MPKKKASSSTACSESAAAGEPGLQDDVHNNSKDPLVSAMLLLAKAITQNFSNPTNNRLRASSNTRNQAIIQGDRVNIQSRNSGNTGRNSRRAYVQEEVVEGMNAPKETGNVQRTLRTPSLGNTSTVQCYNCSGKGHYARNCPKPRVRDSKYFMEQMLLAKQDEAGVILTDEQNDFLFADASRMEEIKELSANICLMARIQPADHTFDDGPSYESAFISEVQSSSIDENNEPIQDWKKLKKKTDVPKTEENHVVSKPVTLQTSPTKQTGANQNTNVIRPGMYRVVTTQESQTNKTKSALSSTIMNATSRVRRPTSRDSHVAHNVLDNSKKAVKNVAVYVRKNKQTDNTSANVILNKQNVIDVDVANASKAKKLLCVSCMQNVLIPCHDKCVAKHKLNVRSNVRRTFSTNSRPPKSSETTFVAPKTSASKAKDKVVQIVLWVVDSGCSKHMMGDRSLLKNFIEKFMGTVRFGNDNLAAITGYGDYIHGNITICHVYYVEGLGHNLFSVGQFYDGDLEVAFHSNTCYVRNLQGDDLLTGGRDSNLYTISISDMAASSPVCLMSKATSTKSWLWHRRLSHLNFGTINDLTRLDLVDGLPKFKYGKDHLCSAYERGKSKKASHPPKMVPKYTWVYFLRSKDETLEIIKKFIAQAQLNYKAKVCKIRTDNVHEDSSSTSSIFVDAHEALSVVTTSDEQTSPISFIEADEFNQEDTANFDGNAQFVPYNPPSREEIESSTMALEPSNVKNFHQVQPSTHIWTKDHPLDQVIGDPSKPVMTRQRLHTNSEVCMMFIAYRCSIRYHYLSKWDVKTAFLQWSLKIEVYVSNAEGFLIQNFPDQSKVGPDIALLLLYVLVIKAVPSVKHLKEVKRIFRYLRQSYNMGLWYPKDSGFELIAYSDADHAGCKDDCKSTSGGLHFLEHVEKGIVEIYFVGIEYQLADLFTKALPKECFEYLVHRIDECPPTKGYDLMNAKKESLISLACAMPTEKANSRISSRIIHYDSALQLLHPVTMGRTLLFASSSNIFDSIFQVSKIIGAVESSAPRRSTVIRLHIPERRSTHLTPLAPVSNIDKADEIILQDTLQVSLAEHKSREEQEARENVALVDEHLASEGIEKKVDGQKNVVDDSSIPRNDESNIPGTRIEPRSNKESPEVKITKDKEVEITKDKEVEITKETSVVDITNVVIPVNVNDEDEEITDEVYELKRREKGKIIEETRNLPISTPIRSPRIHTNLVSSDTEKLQELTDTHTTSSSSSPHTKSYRDVMVTCLHIYGRVYVAKGLILERQKAKEETERLIAKAILQEHGNIQAQISTQIENAIANVIPSQVDASVRSYMSGHILHVHPAQSQTSSVPEQQYQLYLAMKADPQLQQQDIAIWLALQMKFERNTVLQTACRTPAVRPRDQDDPHDDAHPEGENSAKRQKTSEYEAYVSGESSSGQVFQEEQAPSTSGNQEQDDDFDFWTDSYASDDDEIPTKQVSQDIMEEVSLTIDEAKLRKMADEMLRQRCTSGDEHQYHIDQMKNFLKNPEAPTLSLINQDLLYLKKGNYRPEKIVLSLYKFPAIIFNDDDIEERTSRWVNKCVKKFNPYARYGVEHWKNPHAKIFYIRKQKEPGKPKEDIYSNSKIVQVIKTYWELGQNKVLFTELLQEELNVA
ncbi:integrase, catalytic region, zinc finger, CCHC-type containing protein [Tanacetum coccineum]